MSENPRILKSMEQAHRLAEKYCVPVGDIIMMGLNMEGIDTGHSEFKRVRFELSPSISEKHFYLALTNTDVSRWKHDGSAVYFEGELIGMAKEPENDTCDNTYFRRFLEVGGKRIGTELTVNSNSRSSCAGCGFCGTYNLNPEDADEKDLTTPLKMHRRIEKLLDDEGLDDLSHIVEVGVVTGCFNSEDKALEHLVMLSDVLRGSYGFEGELKYVGSEVRSEKALDELSKYAGPAGISLTVECFTKRDKILKPSKRISLDEGRDVLGYAKSKGIRTTILYIMGIDPIEIFEEELPKYSGLLTKLPVINTMQEYEPRQAVWKDPEARDIEYYLKARGIVEEAFGATGLRPNVWENYRGLFFTRFNGGDIDGPLI